MLYCSNIDFLSDLIKPFNGIFLVENRIELALFQILLLLNVMELDLLIRNKKSHMNKRIIDMGQFQLSKYMQSISSPSGHWTKEQAKGGKMGGNIRSLSRSNLNKIFLHIDRFKEIVVCMPPYPGKHLRLM